MKRKNSSVNLERLNKEMKVAMVKTENACKAIEGKKYEITITSAKDGKHKINSKHYTGDAIDIRTRDMKYPSACTIRIKIEIGDDYDVINEGDHIHIEYDPKTNKSWKK